MKTMIVLASLLILNVSQAGVFLEPLTGSDQIFRGRAPKSTEMSRLTEAGITTVLIFKNQTKNEVDQEIKQLKEIGISARKIHHIPFTWKDIESEEFACEQIVEALQILTAVLQNPKDKVLFHCTVGEDRTGLIAGLMSQLLLQTETSAAYYDEMCMKGFAGGNKHKPLHVQKSVDQQLTPLFFKMSELIRTKQLRLGHLDKNVCAQAIQFSADFQSCGQLMNP